MITRGGLDLVLGRQVYFIDVTWPLPIKQGLIDNGYSYDLLFDSLFAKTGIKMFHLQVDIGLCFLNNH